MKNQIRNIASAWLFLTRLPFFFTPQYREKSLVRAAAHFPLVGAVLGSMIAVIFGGSLLVFGPGIAAVLALIATVLLTGALHEDGLADSADALFGGATPERRIEIFKDSRIGSFGAVALVLSLLLRWAVLEKIGVDVSTANPPDLFRILVILTLTMGVSRWHAAALQFLLPYAGNPDAARGGYTVGIPAKTFVAATLWIAPLVVVLYFETGLFALIYLLIQAVVLAGARALFKQKIGGYTGDTLGAAIVVSECVSLLFFAVR